MNTEKLASMFPIMVIENKTPFQQHISYGNGDTVTIQPLAKSKITSAGLHQVPDSSIFSLISPTLSQLTEAGIITVTVNNPGKQDTKINKQGK
jgi:hypothetical protein